MERRFVLLHGLPGSGKSSVCRAIAERLGWYYADLGASEDFRKVPSAELCARLYLENGAGRSLLTEGVYSSRKGRDAFVARVSERLQANGVSRPVPLIIFLDETIDILASRRNRTADEYRELRAQVETGSKYHDYEIYTSHGEGVEERAENISRVIAAHRKNTNQNDNKA